MRKEGQITVYVILGLVLVLGLILFVYVQQNTTLFRPKEVVPAWVEPIKIQTESCMSMLGYSAVNTMAFRGGYLELPAVFNNPYNQEATMPFLGPFKVPLWWHNGRDYRPTRKDMEQQLSRHIQQNINDCVDNFSDHRGQFDITELGLPAANVTIADEQVIFKLNYPLQVVNRGSGDTTELKNYYATVNLSLGKMHDLATEIMTIEQKTQFLERLTMEMIAGSEMPFEGIEIYCGRRQWSIRRDLKPMLENLLKYNLHFLNFVGTNRLPSEYPYFESIYKVNLSKSYPNIRVSTDATFSDAWWLKMAVRPGSGDKVTTLGFGLPLVGSCVKVYHHRYNLHFPLLFQLTENSGFTFNFATPVIIQDNEPYRQQSFYAFDTEELGTNDEEYCDSAEHLMVIRAKDKATDEYVDNATISLRCVRARCELGKTAKPFIPGTSIPNVAAPPSLSAFASDCYNGLFIATKDGYLPGYTFADTVGDAAPRELAVSMTPLTSLDLEVRVVSYPGAAVRRLARDEIAMVSIANEPNNYQQDIYYPEDNQTLDLISGENTYSLMVTVAYNDSITGMLDTTWTPVVSGTKAIVYAVATDPLPQDEAGLQAFWETVDAHSAENLPRII
ncbi:MAG: hypothetical protein V1735_00885 [Nanoarchaeota archaeon]